MGTPSDKTNRLPTSQTKPPGPLAEDPAPRKGVDFRWFLLGIAPIPVGLIIKPLPFPDFDLYAQPVRLAFFVVLTLACSVVGGIGQCGGFKEKSFRNIALGVFAGIGIAAFDVFVVFFLGCCSAFSQL